MELSSCNRNQEISYAIIVIDLNYLAESHFDYLDFISWILPIIPCMLNPSNYLIAMLVLFVTKLSVCWIYLDPGTDFS